MTDPYAISESRSAAPPPASGGGSGIVRPILWVLLVISAAGNMVAQTAGVNMFVGAGFGAATLACGAALIVQHYRNRRR